MLMTDGVGKAGGQSVQRRGSIRVLRNISIPTQRIASTMNPQRFVNSTLFSAFSLLTKEKQDQWKIIGNNLVGLNIWGDSKTFSAREAFLKCNGVYYPYILQLVDEENFNYTSPSATFTSCAISVTAQEMPFTVVTSDNFIFYQMKAIRNRSSAVNPIVDKLKTFYRTTDWSDSVQNFEELEKTVGKLFVGDFLTIAVRAVSAYGLVSPWNIFNVEAT